MADTFQTAAVKRTASRLPLPAAFVAAATLFWGSGAAALPPPQPVSPFVVTGFLKAATLGGADDLAGGTLTVNDHLITIPRNTIVLMPAAFLTWPELFTLAPLPYGPTQTGLAMSDVPAPLTTWEVTVQGNRVGDEYIAGLVAISQQSIMTGQGFINYMDYATGEMRVGGTIGDPNSGTRIRINDPLGRFSRPYSPDVRFTIDEDNPTIRTETAYPMCFPRWDPASRPDPDCPQTNRPTDPATGLHKSIFTMSATLEPGTDPFRQAPFEVGDYVTYAGEFMKDGPEPTVGPLPPPGQTFISAWSIVANLGIFTAPGADPVYIAIDVAILGVGGAPAPGLPQEATVRTRFEGFATDYSRVVDLFGIDVDPCTGAISDRPWGTIDVDPGPLSLRGAVKGRWRFRPPTKVLSLPPAGTFLPVTREVRAKIRGALVQESAHGILSGQYHAPIAEYLFPENLGIGNPPVPLNLQDFPFLARGSGPWQGAGVNPVPSGIVGQLSPWPGMPAPAPVVCNAAPPSAPTANAGPTQLVNPGTTVLLDGAGSSDPNGLALAYTWTQATGPSVTLSNAAAPRPTFTAPSSAGGTTLSFSLVVRNTSGLSSAPSTVTIRVNAGSAVQQPPIANAGVNVSVASGALVHLDGSASSDPNVPALLPLSFLWTQIGGPLVTMTGGGSAAPSFTAPIVPPGPALDLTFNLTVRNSAGLGANSAPLTITVRPVTAPTANAGPNQVVLAGNPVTLSGAASFDPQGLPLTYTWTQVAGPFVTLTGASTSAPSFTAIAGGAATYAFTLVVNNGFLSSVPALVTVAAHNFTDNVTIVSAVYRIAKERLTVTAASSDPAAVLTLQGFGVNGVQFTLLNGVLTADIVGVPEPSSVTVTSSLGGSATSGITRLR